MEYILGIDSGATSSEVLITDYRGKEFFRKIYPPVNYNLLGFKKTTERLMLIITKSLQRYNNDICCIVIGLSGAREEKDRKIISEAIIQKTGFRNVYVYPDTAIAFASEFEHGQKNCGILIAGTGSVLYYLDSHGQINRAGGWGRIIGDEGSGYWIGREALKRITMYYDGIGEDTMLVKFLKKKYKLGKDSVIQAVYHDSFDISQIAKTVFYCADKGDKVSTNIIKEAAVKIAEHFRIFKKRKYTIALCGSLFTQQYLLEKYLRKITKLKYPIIKLIKSLRPPVWGAIEIGKFIYNLKHAG